MSYLYLIYVLNMILLVDFLSYVLFFIFYFLVHFNIIHSFAYGFMYISTNKNEKRFCNCPCMAFLPGRIPWNDFGKDSMGHYSD